MDSLDPDFRIETTIRLLNENSSRTISQLAGACTLSSSSLSHLFKAEVGLTVGKFRNGCRFGEAKKLLARPDLSIKEIAGTLGYRHTSSFTRAFELHVGRSPTDYRKAEFKKNAQQLRLKNSRKS